MTDSTVNDLVASAAHVGRHAASIEQGLFEHGQKKSDDIHHLGDDTGRLVTRAYSAGGAAGAADVIDSYLAAFNRVRSENGRAELSAHDAIDNLQWAIVDDGITRTEQYEVRAEFARRHP